MTFLLGLNSVLCILHLANAMGVIASTYNLDVPNNIQETFMTAVKQVNGPPGLNSSGIVSITWVAAMFFAVTAMVHFIYALNPGGIYDNMIQDENNYIRWLEYTVTATLMKVIVCLNAGVNIASEIFLHAMCTAVTMIQGQIVERNIRENRVSDCILPTITGWLLEITSWSIILTKFGLVISQVNGLDIPAKIPDWVYAVIFCEFGLFMSFAIVQVVHIAGNKTAFTKEERVARYKKIETAYDILSLVAKTLLGWVVAGGLISSSDGQVNASTKPGNLPVLTTSNSNDTNWYYLAIPAIMTIVLPMFVYLKNQESQKNAQSSKIIHHQYIHHKLL